MTGPVVSGTEARELLRRFADDRRACRQVRVGCAARDDPLDLLAWLACPGSTGPSGARDPRADLKALRSAAFDRPRPGVIDPREARRVLRCRADAWRDDLAALTEALDALSQGAAGRRSRRRSLRQGALVTVSAAVGVALVVTGASWWSSSRIALSADRASATRAATAAADLLRREDEQDPERLTETFFRLPQQASDRPPVETPGIDPASLRRTFPVSDVNLWVGRGDDGGFCLVTVAPGGSGQACRAADRAVAEGVRLDVRETDGTEVVAHWNIRDGLLQLTVTPPG